MAEYRFLRDWTNSEKIDKLSSGAETFFNRLIMKADDLGSFHGNIKLLKSNLFPLKTTLKESEVEEWLKECVNAGIIKEYKSSNKPAINIIKFGQRTYPYTKTKFPDDSEINNDKKDEKNSKINNSREFTGVHCELPLNINIKNIDIDIDIDIEIEKNIQKKKNQKSKIDSEEIFNEIVHEEIWLKQISKKSKKEISDVKKELKEALEIKCKKHEVDFEQIFEEITTMERWHDEVSRLYKIDASIIKEKVIVFMNELKVKDDYYKSYREIRNHFVNVLKKQIEKEKDLLIKNKNGKQSIEETKRQERSELKAAALAILSGNQTKDH